MRIRTIKPEFWIHEGLCQLSEFTRLLALALLNWADDEGYFMANPAVLRGSLFPFLDDSKTIPRSLQDLSRVGWIELGTDTQGRAVGRVLNFAKHQRVDKPKPSEIKASSTFQDASKTHPRTIQDASKEERKGMEGNGEEPKGKDFGVPPCTREQVRSFAPMKGLTEAQADYYYDTRNASGWTRGTSGGGAPRQITSWQSDMASSVGWIKEGCAKAAKTNQSGFAGIQEDIEIPFT